MNNIDRRKKHGCLRVRSLVHEILSRSRNWVVQESRAFEKNVLNDRVQALILYIITLGIYYRCYETYCFRRRFKLQQFQ